MKVVRKIKRKKNKILKAVGVATLMAYFLAILKGLFDL